VDLSLESLNEIRRQGCRHFENPLNQGLNLIAEQVGLNF